METGRPKRTTIAGIGRDLPHSRRKVDTVTENGLQDTEEERRETRLSRLVRLRSRSLHVYRRIPRTREAHPTKE